MRDTQKLPCPLTDREVAARSEDAADFREKRSALSTAVKQLAKQVRERAEEREVEIEYVHDPVRFCVDTKRCDTGEVIESRPMSSDEEMAARQETLPMVGRRSRAKGGEA